MPNFMFKEEKTFISNPVHTSNVKSTLTPKSQGAKHEFHCTTYLRLNKENSSIDK